MSDSSAARLERLELIEMAKVVTARYGRAVDAKDLHELRTEVFADEIVLRTSRAEHHGIDAVIDVYAQAFADQPGTRRHFLANQIAEVTGPERVDVESYFLFVSADARSVIGWGSYRDAVMLHGGSARIVHKTIVVDVFTTLDDGWAVPAHGSGQR